MDGVTILNTMPFSESLVGFREFLLLMISIGISTTFMVMGIMIERHGYELRYLIATVVIGLVLILLLYGGKALVENWQRDTYYEVTVSDDVKFNDFNDKYEIIEQRDNIFVVMERKQPQDAEKK
ncbi:MAG: hypothetical protein J6Y02_14775 [Pseudobutyrivibrio sp.]|nr:hypothetical protein [Pseudobutyrivibrio sp.]